MAGSNRTITGTESTSSQRQGQQTIIVNIQVTQDGPTSVPRVDTPSHRLLLHLRLRVTTNRSNRDLPHPFSSSSVSTSPNNPPSSSSVLSRDPESNLRQTLTNLNPPNSKHHRRAWPSALNSRIPMSAHSTQPSLSLPYVSIVSGRRG
jgi:hypothetical protein